MRACAAPSWPYWGVGWWSCKYPRPQANRSSREVRGGDAPRTLPAGFGPHRAPRVRRDARGHRWRGVPGPGRWRGRVSGQVPPKPGALLRLSPNARRQGTPQPGLPGPLPQPRAVPEPGGCRDPAAAWPTCQTGDHAGPAARTFFRWGPAAVPRHSRGPCTARAASFGVWRLRRNRSWARCFSSSSFPLCCLPSLLLASSPFCFLLPLRFCICESYFLFSLLTEMTPAGPLRARNLRRTPCPLPPLSRPVWSQDPPHQHLQERLLEIQSLRPIQT